MDEQEVLSKIRKELFYDSEEYTKNQPDFYLSHRPELIAPSAAGAFMSRIKEAVTEPQIMLYAHFPFCFTECRFCNAFPHKIDSEKQRKYIEDLTHEIQLFADHGIFDGKSVKCIYFGGGTPTAFTNEQLGCVVDRIKSVVTLEDDCSFTVEAHPLTLTKAARVQGLRDMGVTRISTGCQTFDPVTLEYCNRSNSEELVTDIVKIVHDSGMAINIDMMTGLPGQTMEGIQRDLAILEKIRPDSVEYIRHEIVNPLAVDLMINNPELVVDSDTLFNMVHLTQQWMAENGYEQNGTFSSPKQWEYRYHWIDEMPILAFGARSRSYTKDFCYDKHEELTTYSAMLDRGQPPIGRFIPLSKRDQMYRTIFLSLQRKSGIRCREFQDRYDVAPRDAFAALFDGLLKYDCIVVDESSIRLSQYGAYFVEDICDYIMDYALTEESTSLERTPNSAGSTSARLKDAK